MEKYSSDLLKNNIDKLMDKSLKKNVFTASSVGFMVNREKVFKGDIFNYGSAADIQGKYSFQKDMVFDLASLTKPLVTSLCILVLIEEGKIFLEDKLNKFFDKTPPATGDITIFDLLTHSSGFPAHRPYYQKLIDIPSRERKEILIKWILAEKLIFEPGTDNLYSDLGFILLGRIIEIISEESLDEYWRRKLNEPLGLTDGLFFTNKKQRGLRVYAATGLCHWSKKQLSGMVNDDNCRALGGVAGHAGLFGTAQAVLSLCESLLLQFSNDGNHPSFSSSTLQKALRSRHGSWVFGFDTPTGGLSSSGKYFTQQTIGHLGFTGTSFWIDLHRQIAIVILTNRVACGDSLTAIKKLRPLVHDTIMENLIKKSG